MQKEQFDALVRKVQKLMERHIHNHENSLREFGMIANELVKDFENISTTNVVDMYHREANLYEHTVMVTLYALQLANLLKLEEIQKYQIAIGCLLHDIGMRYITIPFTNRDMNTGNPAMIFEYKKHTILGYSALEKESWIPEISLKMILSHHEKLDGTGFPMRQKNREIECRMIQICDAFDRYISGSECVRMNVFDAKKNLEDGAGNAYDAKLVSLFLSIV